MAYDDLREFIRALEKHGELKRIPFEVDPYLEITEFADRSVKSGGPALLFEKPKGSDVPVLINAFASMRRMEIALEVSSVEEIAGRISELLAMQKPEGLLGKLKMLPKLAELASIFPKIVSSGPCKDVIRREGKFDLSHFPILHCWPQDAGRFITLPMVFSRNPDTGKRNCGCYRLQVFDGATTGMHWQTHKQGAEHYRRLRAAGGAKRMDIAVAIGADPATMYSAILPLPPDLDEMMIAGFLRGKPVEMVKCETNDLRGARQQRDRARRLRRARRASPRGAVRRSHRLLLARRRLPGVPRHLHHASQEPDLRDHHRRPAAHGGFLHGQGHRAHLSAFDAPAASRDPRYRHARGGHLPQPDSGGDPQILSGPRAQSDARDLGARPGDVLEVHRRGG